MMQQQPQQQMVQQPQQMVQQPQQMVQQPQQMVQQPQQQNVVIVQPQRMMGALPCPCCSLGSLRIAIYVIGTLGILIWGSGVLLVIGFGLDDNDARNLLSAPLLALVNMAHILYTIRMMYCLGSATFPSPTELTELRSSAAGLITSTVCGICVLIGCGIMLNLQYYYSTWVFPLSFTVVWNIILCPLADKTVKRATAEYIVKTNGTLPTTVTTTTARAPTAYYGPAAVGSNGQPMVQPTQQPFVSNAPTRTASARYP